MDGYDESAVSSVSGAVDEVWPLLCSSAAGWRVLWCCGAVIAPLLETPHSPRGSAAVGLDECATAQNLSFRCASIHARDISLFGRSLPVGHWPVSRAQHPPRSAPSPRHLRLTRPTSSVVISTSSHTPPPPHSIPRSDAPHPPLPSPFALPINSLAPFSICSSPSLSSPPLLRSPVAR